MEPFSGSVRSRTWSMPVFSSCMAEKNMFRKYPSEPAKHHIAPLALKQGGPQLQLQGIYGSAQRGLADAQQLSGALVVLCTGQDLKILQLVKCHRVQRIRLSPSPKIFIAILL